MKILKENNKVADVKDVDYVVEMKNITKSFAGKKANDDVTLQLKKGEIHALLGENGAGKSTLMSILFGLYQPDEGEIFVNRKKENIKDPNDATKLGIGMVHQHFKLVEVFSVLDNIILGEEPLVKKMQRTEKDDILDKDKSFLGAMKKTWRWIRNFSRTIIGRLGFISRKEARKKVIELSKQYGLNVDVDALIEDITVGMQQRVEILKMLYRENDILIFDEPTAVLTPQEIDELMAIMRSLTKEGKSILFITHKLNEIMAVADRCSVLRKGKYIGTVNIKDTTKEELSKMMVGRNVQFVVDKKSAKPKETVLGIKDLCVKSKLHKKDAVHNVSLDVKAGEIVCIAGIDGNGQSEFIQAITGLEQVESGNILMFDTQTDQMKDITQETIRFRNTHGMSHVPEDRHKHGLVLDYSLAQNLVLQRYFEKPFQKYNFINEKEISDYADRLIEQYDVRSSSGAKSIARGMSGGNQQKAIFAREIDKPHKLLVAVQPTRGLDVGAIEYLHKRLIEDRDNGAAILLVSYELDEVMSVSDRICVMYEGEIVGELKPKKTTVEELGLYMSGAKRQGVKA